MKLSSLYSNDAKVFPRIDFLSTGLNVVFAKVFDPANLKKDSHNLGKTFLIRVLDFALMGGVDKDHPFRRYEDRFGHFVFFCEVITNDGLVVTIRRPVHGRSAICINTSRTPHGDYSTLPVEHWNHSRIGTDKAEEILNSYLNLTAIRPYDYRKGLGYFLRRQDDYGDEFRTSRFGRGKDLDWKPFMALLLGFDWELVQRKYDIEREIDAKSSLLKEAHTQANNKSATYDEIKGLWQARKAEAERLRSQVERFDFREVESAINATTVSQMESRIADENRRRYEIDRELEEIAQSLRPDYQFDIARIRTIFEEASIYFPDNLANDYARLIEFNRNIAEGRKERLRQLQSELQSKRAVVSDVLRDLNVRRIQAMSLLQERRTLEKYRELNHRLMDDEEEVRQLRTTLESLDRIEGLKEQVAVLEKARDDLGKRVRKMLREGCVRYELIRSLFYKLTQRILGVGAILAVDPNTNDNLEFRTRIIQTGERPVETSLSDGTSYKKLLCACFDLSLLIAYSKEQFYRFVYHDGIFEGLDNRRKGTLLDAVREVCASEGLQYVLTVIDSDLPRSADDQKLLFTSTEVVRELDDRGNAGRLFRMPPF